MRQLKVSVHEYTIFLKVCLSRISNFIQLPLNTKCSLDLNRFEQIYPRRIIKWKEYYIFTQ